MSERYLNNHCVHPSQFGDVCCKCGANNEELNVVCKGTALHHEVEAPNWERIVTLQGQKKLIQNEIDNRKENAVKELRELGHSFDSITHILGIGKITAINIEKRLKELKEGV
jgi:hypothetical protein